MKKEIAAGLAFLFSASMVAAQDRRSDPRAVEVADRVLEALGGVESWNAARFIRFTFVRGDERLTLTWDKWTGRFRLDATTADGKPYVVLMNVETRQGRAYVAGRELEGEELDTFLNRAHRVWAGETYWLLMPYKLKDPGVVLDDAGEETLEGAVYDKLHITFEGVGLTPGDQFWAWVNRDTGLMDKWRFVLESGFEGEYWWREWQPYGTLLLSPIREGADGSVIRMEDILVTGEMEDEVFTSPEPPASPQ